jgi:hypothetical protein
MHSKADIARVTFRRERGPLPPFAIGRTSIACSGNVDWLG